MHARQVRPWLRAGLGLVGLGLLVAFPLAAAAQVGQVTGTITNQAGQPIGTVQVFVQGTSLGGLSSSTGSFTLTAIPAGSHRLVAQRIGYQTYQADVTVVAGQTATVNIVMNPNVLALQEIVATGLVDPVEGVRSPITVARVNRETMPLPVAGGALQALQGRVAGMSMTRQSGQPGQDVFMSLRTPTSATPPDVGGPSTQPLIVVDGVILGGSSTVNIEPSDIASIEVIKGAAASSLYGSRAASGVVAITTIRGQNLAIGATQFSYRSEFGYSQLNRDLPRRQQSHSFRMDPAQTTYVDLAGNPVGRGQRVRDRYTFADKPFPGGTFDNLASAFNPGSFQTHNFTVAQNTDLTNFAVTLNRYVEAGPLENHDGYERNSFRINMDHRFLQDFQLGVSAYHSRDKRDDVRLSINDIVFAPPDVDISAKDENGEYVRVLSPENPIENPLWEQGSREGEQKRVRTLASANLRWDPLAFLSFRGSVSYDRQDSKGRSWVPKGTPTSVTSDTESDGVITFSPDLRDTWNAEAQASVMRDFGPLNVRTTLRSVLEMDRQENLTSTGRNFFVQGVPRLNAAADQSTTSSEEEIRAVGYLWDTALDYDDRYIATALVRRDGSSLFGPDNRWHTYYRAAFAWRMAAEPWFNVNGVDELKLSYARGTAGGRPQFASQYETWSVGSAGVSKGVMGNRNLRPEHSMEQEISLNAILFENYGIQLTHAWHKTTEQLFSRPVPAFNGFSHQWTNGGTVEGHTTEATLEAQLVSSPTRSWTAMLVADRSDAEITEWPYPDFNPSFRNLNVGSGVFETWSAKFMTTLHQLGDCSETGTNKSGHHGGLLCDRKDEFMVNDDGWLVWVGEGNHYTDGLWGTQTTIGGLTYRWGEPLSMSNAGAGRYRQPIQGPATVNLGLVNNFRFGQLSVHTHMSAQIGGEMFTLRNQAFANEWGLGQDQRGRPEELKKPLEYYLAQAITSSNPNGSRTHLKVRAVSLSYALNPSQISRYGPGALGIKTMTLGLIGRDLFIASGCACFDPEFGTNLETRQLTGGGNNFPSTRQFTGEVSITF